MHIWLNPLLVHLGRFFDHPCFLFGVLIDMLLRARVYQIDLEICKLFWLLCAGRDSAVCEVPEVDIVCAEILEGLEGRGDLLEVGLGSGERCAFEN